MINTLYNALRGKLGLDEFRTLRFQMKSGNVIVAKAVNTTTFKYNYTGNEITQIKGFKQRWYVRERLMIQSVDLSQIEAITAQ